ncbi:hypothetical protein HYU17_03090 [Candidatus Woesearchaeota archaeon]|nr:hypothetical protein [Candidatus Woesearchaeota archaeon]
MDDGLEQVASGVIGAIEERAGLQALLWVPDIKEMWGRFGGAAFYEPAMDVLTRLRRVAETNGLTNLVRDYSQMLAVAQSLLEKERQRAPIPTTACDADSRMWHDPETGRHYITVGGGHLGGGYSIELVENGENRLVRG